MNKKQIVIEIDKDGNCTIDGENFQGTECDRFISEIERALGKTTHSVKKAEYNQRVNTRQRERN